MEMDRIHRHFQAGKPRPGQCVKQVMPVLITSTHLTRAEDMFFIFHARQFIGGNEADGAFTPAAEAGGQQRIEFPDTGE